MAVLMRFLGGVVGLLSVLVLQLGTAWSALAAVEWGADGSAVRLKELVNIQGVRDNQLHGIGIVVGLDGTGDGNAATVKMLRQALASLNLSFDERDLVSNNVAMVSVTADLPAFARNGERLATTIATVGDASSLRGGRLLQTYLYAATGDLYAAAQGPVSVGGYGDAGPAGTPVGRGHQNLLTVGTLEPGAIVERELGTTLLQDGKLQLVLKQADFSMAHQLADLVDGQLASRAGMRAMARDAATVDIYFREPPKGHQLVELIAELEQLTMTPEGQARIVVNARTGTVVVGSMVKISPAAVSHGGLSVQIRPVERAQADPQNPNNITLVTEYQDTRSGLVHKDLPPGVHVTDQPGTLNVMGAATVEEVANALNAMGARPRDLISIFEALHRAGALHGELVVM